MKHRRVVLPDLEGRKIKRKPYSYFVDHAMIRFRERRDDPSLTTLKAEGCFGIEVSDFTAEQIIGAEIPSMYAFRTDSYYFCDSCSDDAVWVVRGRGGPVITYLRRGWMNEEEFRSNFSASRVPAGAVRAQVPKRGIG